MSLFVDCGKHLPVNETILMNCVDSQNNLSNIESRNVLRENLIFDEHSHKITSWQELHQHIEEVRILEGCVELHHPWAIRLSQDITFRADMRQLILLEHLVFDERLHCVNLCILLLLDELDFPERALANDFDGSIVVR